MTGARIFAMAAAAVLISTPALAQMTRPERPYRGLFGGGYGDSEQMLSLNTSFGGGYDGNILLGNQGATVNPVDPRQATASTIVNGSAGLTYSFSKQHVSFNASGGWSGVDYPSLQQSFYPGYGGSAGGAVGLSTRTSLSFNESVYYQPFYVLPSGEPIDNTSIGENKAVMSKLSQSLSEQFGEPVDLGLVPTTAPSDIASNQYEGHTNWTTSAALGHRLTKRVSASLSYTRFQSSSSQDNLDLLVQSPSVGVSVAIAKGLAFRLAYGYTEALYGTDRVRGQNIDAGLDFSRALSMSLSRRTTLTFGTGTSIVSDTQEQTRLVITGNANLTQEIGRSWQASLVASRGVGYIEGFLRPVISDVVSASFGGLISRRVQFHSVSGVTWGAVGLVAASNNFTTYNSGAGITVGLSRSLGLSLDYAYYRYSFDSGIVLPAGLSNHVNRQSIRASISFWQPLFHRARRSNATR